MKTPWLPEPLPIPGGFETDRLRVRPLTIHDAVKDYDAVMSSRQALRGLFGPGSEWPPENLSLEQDLIDLAWHQKEFELRTSFAYTVVSPDGAQVLGCAYLMPPSQLDCDAEVYFWVRSSEQASGLEDHLAQCLARWLADAWPFRRVIYPGRGAAPLRA